MAEWDYWTITGPSFLDTRGNQSLLSAAIGLNNAYFLSDGVLQMRQGFDDASIDAAALAGRTLWIGRHVSNAGDEEGWAASDDSGTSLLARRTTGSWLSASFSDTANSNALHMMQSATQNGKLFLAYDSNVNRLHVWDGTSVRRVGLAQATAPTAATMGGAGLTFNRWYRQRNVVQVSGVTVRRSEASTSVNVSITDDQGVTVTKGAASSDGETHWEVEASADSGGASDGVWYRIATVAVGTATSNDTNAAITSFPLTDQDGLYYTPPSCKYIISDGAVLLMAGAWESSSSGVETAPFQNRVWFTRPLGATDISDDESITTQTSLKNWIDIGDTGPITGLAGPLYGDIYVFKANSIWKLVPTGDLVAPYRKVLVHDSAGALDQVAIASGTVKGIPTIYFASSRNIWALGSSGVHAIGDPILGSFNLSGLVPPSVTSSLTYARLMFNSDNESLWLKFAVTTPMARDHGYLFDAYRATWSEFNSSHLDAARATMLGSRFYVVGGTSTNRILIQRGLTAQGYVGKDVSTSYTASVTYRKHFAAAGLGRRVTIGHPTITYRAPSSGSTFNMTVTLRADLDQATDQSEVVLLAQSGTKTLESLTMSDLTSLQVEIALAIDSGGSVQDNAIPPIIDVVQIPFLVNEELPR